MIPPGAPPLRDRAAAQPAAGGLHAGLPKPGESATAWVAVAPQHSRTPTSKQFPKSRLSE